MVRCLPVTKDLLKEFLRGKGQPRETELGISAQIGGGAHRERERAELSRMGAECYRGKKLSHENKTF